MGIGFKMIELDRAEKQLKISSKNFNELSSILCRCHQLLYRFDIEKFHKKSKFRWVRYFTGYTDRIGILLNSRNVFLRKTAIYDIEKIEDKSLLYIEEILDEALLFIENETRQIKYQNSIAEKLIGTIKEKSVILQQLEGELI